MSYRRYAAERTIASISVFLLALVLIFFMFRVWARPGGGPEGFPEDAAILRDFWDGSFGDRAWEFISQYGQGSLGRAPDGTSHTAPLLRASLVSLSIVIGAIGVGLTLGLPLALLWRRRGPAVLPARLVGMLLAGALPVWGALLLSYFVAYRAGIFPVAGYCDFFGPPKSCNGPPDWAWHLVLPWFSLGLWFAGLYAAAFRRVLEATDRTVAAAASSERLAVRKRGRRLLGVAVAKRAARDVGFGLGIVVMIELVFSLRGLGYEFYRSFSLVFDLPGVEGALVLMTALALGIDLVVNLAGAAIEPEWRTR